MPQRSPELQNFLHTLHQAILARAADNLQVQAVTSRIMQALETPGIMSDQKPRLLPVCELLDSVCNEVEAFEGPAAHSLPLDTHVVQHARAVQQLSHQLLWWRRANPDALSEPFASGHANTMVVGPRGLEQRNDVWVGISLMAPEICYPVHHHAPEEVYLVLSEGKWQQAGTWHEPGVGGVVHNPPDVLHAMSSGPRPLLATWCLWLGQGQ